MKILFISHSYPPIVGGVENQNFELYTWLSKITEVKLLANKKRWLIPFFLIYASIKAIFSVKKYDVILLGSCLLGNVGWLVKKFSQKPVLSVAHGLDLTWKNKIYQKLWIKKFILSLDKLIAVGNETIAAGINRDIPKEKFVFIPNGVDTEKHFQFHAKDELEKIIGEKLDGRKTILTTGRLAAHKGIDWFCENVMPKMEENILYIIVGDGEKKDEIKKVIEKNNLKSKVKMLGYINDNDRDILYNTADVYVKPNIKVEGTMEGFGLVAIEAASCKIPVVASNLEGLKDAIKDGQNGFLIEPYDTCGYVKKINELLADDNLRKEFGEKARQFVVENYSWEKISKKYLEEIKKACLPTRQIV
jgi:phosphatidylinositol alpha-1,6-mannosyltransferase